MPELDLTMPRARLAQVRRGRGGGHVRPAIFRVAGAGALACLQGLLTNDLEKPGDGSLVYGALLTPKGMIVVDAWVLRQAETLTLVVPRRGREAALELFRRALPPAACAGHRSDRRVAGRLARRRARVPDAGEVGHRALPTAPAGWRVGGEATAARGPRAGDRARSWRCWPGRRRRGRGAERAAGRGRRPRGRRVRSRTRSHPRAAGPRSGVEIDERTLPQEVRYDEIGGVSYTKGCYTGPGDGRPAPLPRPHQPRAAGSGLERRRAAPAAAASSADGKEVGTVRSTLTLEDRTLGLAHAPARDRARGTSGGGRPAGDRGARCRSADESAAMPETQSGPGEIAGARMTAEAEA